MPSFPDSARPSGTLITLDWGTSSLRAHLLGADGVVLESRAEPWGIMQVRDRDFTSLFDQITGAWRAANPELTVIAAGMIGSSHGWLEAPYCPAPAGVAELTSSLVQVPGVPLFIVPGVALRGENPSVMRGEETQVIGVLATRPELAARSVLVLPGTHSKWVQVTDSRIVTFESYMTGELFAVLRAHSILGRFAADSAGGGELDAVVADEAFRRGVRAARDSPRGIAPLLFSARGLVLLGELPPKASLEYLSGLLIGEEVRCGLLAFARPHALVGDAALCARYAVALKVFGFDTPLVIENAAESGLWEIAERASLDIRHDTRASAER